MSKGLKWRVNTPQLLREIMENNETQPLRIPISIFGSLLAAVGERAAELNDAKLNSLMCRLSMYSVSDPYNSEYDADLTHKTIYYDSEAT